MGACRCSALLILHSHSSSLARREAAIALKELRNKDVNDDDSVTCPEIIISCMLMMISFSIPEARMWLSAIVFYEM